MAIRKVLIANRGEIAVRIIRACHDLGIGTVAVFSEADRTALHVRYADEAYSIGPAPARDSYLRIDKLIEVARQSGADAIHPGYGFLSERAELADACIEAGITFIGPSPAAIRALGDKVTAKRIATQEGLPLVEGTENEVSDPVEAREIADRIGYPVLLKAAAGGGGKGMRVVRSGEEVEDALRLASNEAQSAFGHGGVYIEKYLESVRHVEIQVLGDNSGNLIHLGERECSIQRRHQKLIEESPSPVVTPELRAAMGAAAIRVAAAAGYSSAGTVEFLLTPDGKFYFIEMNTRLQVEHPVTELVTGIDLVQEQLRIAAGRNLRYKQEDITLSGHAIECRITAEDTAHNFRPSTGRIAALTEPSGPGVRVDSALFPGYEVSLYYDPMLSKLICWGVSRPQAILRLRRALEEYRIAGVQTSIPFHQAVMESLEFQSGDFDTSFVAGFDIDHPRGAGASEAEMNRWAVIAAVLATHERREGRTSATTQAPVSNGRSTEAPAPEEQSGWKSAGRRGMLRGG